jgi:hypothetical protein
VTYFGRYQNGEYEQVWAELVSLGSQVRNEPLLTDALNVARETMRRAKHNVQILHERLQKLGYRFNEPHEALVPPESDAAQKIAKLENELGVLPLSLRAWYEVAGAVNFSGTYPKLCSHSELDFASVDDKQILSDPVWVWSIDMILKEGIYWGNDSVLISPDIYHKSAVSGSSPYIMSIPNVAADGILLNEWHETTFVNYLRISFRWGGFPGFDLDAAPASIKPNHIMDIPSDILTFLTNKLLPL